MPRIHTSITRGVTSAATCIVRVLRVVDTREYEEGTDGRYHPIAGSGTEHECSRCGRLHEVHATVLLQDGSEAVVGTGCAGTESMDVQGAMRSAASAAKRIAQLEAERAKLQQLADQFARIRAEVDALPLPPVELGTKDSAWDHHQIPVYRMGDAEVWAVGNEGFTAERRECLIRTWRTNRTFERGATQKHASAAYHLRATETALAKVRSRIDSRDGRRVAG